MRQIIFDTETTGLVPGDDKIVSLAAVEMVDGELTGKFAHYHINPGRPNGARAVEIHGLTDEYLADKPRFSEIIESFDTFIDSSPLIIHNAKFDIGMLEAEYAAVVAANRQVYRVLNPVRCTYVKAEGMRGRAKGRNTLDTLASVFNVQNLRTLTGKHGALVDVLTLFGVYRALYGAGPLPLVQSQIDHYLNAGFGVHGSFQFTSPGSPDVPSSTQVDPPGVSADVCSVG